MSLTWLNDESNKKKKTKKSPPSLSFLASGVKDEEDYVDTIQNRVDNYETRFDAINKIPPPPKENKSFLLKALDIIDRPRNAVVNAIQDTRSGENGALQGAWEGFTGKEHAQVSDMLNPNMNKYARAGLGFVGDVLLDPTTYLTIGAGSVAKNALKEGAEAATKQKMLKFAGQDIADLTPAFKKLGDSAVGKATAPLRQGVADTFGPMFNNRYVIGKASMTDDAARAIQSTVNEIEGLSKNIAGESDVFLNSESMKGLKLIDDETAQKIPDLIELPIQERLSKQGILDKPGLRRNFNESDTTRRLKVKGVDLPPRPPYRESEHLNKFGKTTGLSMGGGNINEIQSAIDNARLPEQLNLFGEKTPNVAVSFNDGVKLTDSMVAQIDPDVSALKAQLDQMIDDRANKIANEWDSIAKHLTDDNTKMLTGWDSKNADFGLNKIGMGNLWDDTGKIYKSGAKKGQPILAKREIHNVKSKIGGKPSKAQIRMMARDTLENPNAWERFGAGTILPNADYVKLSKQYEDAYKLAKEKARLHIKEINSLSGETKETLKRQLREQYNAYKQSLKTPKYKEGTLFDYEDALPRISKEIGKVFDKIEERAWDDIDINDIRQILASVPQRTANQITNAILRGVREGVVDSGVKREIFKDLGKAINFGKTQHTTRELVDLAKSKGMTVSYDEAKALFRVNRMNKETLLRDMGAGIEFDPLSNYVRHLYENDPMTIKQLQNDFALYRAKLNPEKGFMKKRSWETLKDFETFAKEQGVELKPIRDVRQLAAVRELEGISQRAVHKMHQGILKAGDNVIQSIETAPKDWVQLPVKAFKGQAVHPEVARHLERVAKTFESDVGVRNAMKYMNSVQNIWKGWVTTSVPFHLRNALGNLYNNFLGGVVNPTEYAMATAIQNGSDNMFQMGALRMSGQEIFESFRKQGLEGFGQFHGESTKTMLETTRKTLGLEKPGLNAINPLSKDFALVKGSRFIGDKLETNAKLTHYIDRLVKGDTPEMAAESVRKYLFDYSDLTDTEKKIRAFVPFYTWTRKNLPLQLESLFTQPGKPNAVNHLVQNMQNTSGMQEEDMPDWMRNEIAIPIMIKEDGTQLYLSPNLPLSNLNLFGGGDTLRTFAGMLSPIVKVPMIELPQNKQLFTGQPIEKFEGATANYAGYQLPAKTAYVLNQLGPLPKNMASIVQDITGKGKDTNSLLPQNPDRNAALDIVGGSLVRKINPDRTKAGRLLEREQQLSDYRRRLEEVEGITVPSLTDIKKKSNSSKKKKDQSGFSWLQEK